jgi:uncharacterized iron-regulated membrane protein
MATQKIKPKPKKSVFRRIVGWLHLWLGLVSGIVVFVVCITGCLFSFQEEISNLTYKEVFFVKPKNQATLPLSFLNEKAQAALGGDQPINYITTYRDSSRAWEFMAYKMNDTALTYFGATEYFRSAFVDPYTGTVTGIRDYKHDFFNIIKYTHWSLLLNTRIGQPIVGWSTVVFIVLLITGLVLWYPRKWSRAAKRQAFGVKWKARFKRLNYDLHNVLGFYSLLLALVLALTGLVFSFQWFSRVVYVTANGSGAVPFYKPVQSNPQQATAEEMPMDLAYRKALQELPRARSYNISPPYDRESVIAISGYNKTGVYYDTDELRFDQYSGQLLYRRNHKEKSRGEKLIEMNYDIHVGAIGGLAGKIIAFIICLICASLPVTGVLVWWNKRKKPGVQRRRGERIRSVSSTDTIPRV